MAWILAEPYPDAMVARLVLAGVLLAAAGVCGFFAVQNANRWWEANHPPAGAEIVPATVTQVDTEDVCGRTSKSTSTCTTEVDGLDIALADGSTHHAHAHAVFSPGETVKAFRDSDGDWQVKGSFTKTWAARTVGFTALPAIALLVIAVASLLPSRNRKAASESAA